jgi:outer membrane protein assembly factor BamE (lipoprotein component of BamABCDE complex)
MMRIQDTLQAACKNQLLTGAALAIAVLGAQACAPTTHVRGNLLEDHQLKEVDKSTATKSSVRRTLGPPTTKDPFHDNTWYYIGRRTEKYGIFDPEVKARKIVRARFNNQGKLVELAEIKRDDINIPISDRVTPTGGHNNTLLKQFFGNLGRFNTKNPDDSGPIDPGL